MSMTTGVEIKLNATVLAQRVVLVAEALDAMGVTPSLATLTASTIDGSVRVQFTPGFDATPVAAQFGLDYQFHFFSGTEQLDSWNGTWADFPVAILGQDPRRWVDPKARVFCDIPRGPGNHAKWCGASVSESHEAMDALQKRRTKRFAEEPGSELSAGAVRAVVRNPGWGSGSERHVAVPA